MTTAIVTDSTCDIPNEIARQLQIEIIPNILVIEGKSLEDGIDMARQEFYELLPKMKSLPSTAAPSVGAFQSIYERLLSQGVKKILSIHASDSLSGIFNTARIAAQAFKEFVYVIDSKQVTLGLGFQVLEAAEAATRNLPFEAIIEHLEQIRDRSRVIAMLDTIEYVRRSGRISWARAHLGALLDIKPFIELKDGKVFSLGEARTRRRGIERLKGMLHQLEPLERLAILHTNCEKEAHQFLDSLKIHLPSLPMVVNVTTVIGTHVGPNAIGFAVVTR